MNDTLCVLPWLHLATWTDGDLSLCCVAEKRSGQNLNHHSLNEAWNSAYWRRTRTEMLQGRKPKACNRCYEEEKHGYRSHRRAENQAWSVLLGDELEQRIRSTQADGRFDEKPISVDLRLGNQCNLQCVMCSPSESTKWIATAQKLAWDFRSPRLAAEWQFKKAISIERYQWYRNEEFWKSLSEFLPDVREIIVGGGEPMLIREQSRFIRECAESGAASSIRLRYHTNATVLAEELVPYWEKFQAVEIVASIDGVDEINHYVRYPADWAAVEKALEFYRSLPPPIRVQVLCSVHALNFYYVPELLRYLHGKFQGPLRDRFHPSIVRGPEYLDTRILPVALKKKITERIAEIQSELDESFPELDAVVAYMNSEDLSGRLPLLGAYCRALDRARGTNFKSTFSEIRGEISPLSSTV
jgi:organic radical activating enzyme